MVMKEEDNARTLFEEERKFYRYRDKLRWSRIQMIALIEGAVFYVLLSSLSANIEWLKGLFIVPMVFVLVLMFSLMAYKDGLDADFYFKRAARLGEQMGLSPDGPENRIINPIVTNGMLIMLNLYNVYLVWMTWSLTSFSL